MVYQYNTAAKDAGALNPPTITIKGKGNFTGKIVKTFTITKTTVSEADGFAMYIPDRQVYNAANLGGYKTAPVITDGDGRKLVAGTDYAPAKMVYAYTTDVVVKNKGKQVTRTAGEVVNANDIIPAGTVISLTVEFKGSYQGSISGTYKIVSKDIAKATITVYPQYYSGNAIYPGNSQVVVLINGVQVPEDAYTIGDYKNNVNVGTASLTVYGNNELGYGGKKVVNFTIKKCPIAKTIIFNGNGATSGTMANVKMANDYNILPANAFKRPGYRFVGWSLRPDDNLVEYINKQKVDVSGYNKSVLILYAVWEKIQ